MYVDGNKIESKVDAEGNVTATYNRDYNSPIVKNNIEIKYSYTYKTTWDGKPQGSEQTGNCDICFKNHLSKRSPTGHFRENEFLTLMKCLRLESRTMQQQHRRL